MTENTTKPVINILMVEDNPGDVRLTLEALKDGAAKNRLHVVEDGEQAIAFLNRERGYQDSPQPDLILLDLNLPRKDGREVLAEIKSNKDLRRIPIIVLTTSESEEDICQAYELHANCFITKPVDLDRFLEIVRFIERFWFSVVRLPSM